MSYPNISPVFLSLVSQYIYLLYSKGFFPDHAYCVCPRLMLSSTWLHSIFCHSSIEYASIQDVSRKGSLSVRKSSRIFLKM